MGRVIYKVGKVVSDKMDKTRVVVYEYYRMHPVYRKFVKKRTKYYVHDEKNESKVGDVVKIRFTRPLSKLKRWVLVDIIEKAEKTEDVNV
ncbi:MAG: 30S ribosomal protein S17 [Brevinematales bacterium]|nr:30S ribosomal protein S17 [Brevinematales bacterium]